MRYKQVCLTFVLVCTACVSLAVAASAQRRSDAWISMKEQAAHYVSGDFGGTGVTRLARVNRVANQNEVVSFARKQAVKVSDEAIQEGVGRTLKVRGDPGERRRWRRGEETESCG